MLYAILDIEDEPWHDLPHVNARLSLRGIFDDQEKAKQAITEYFTELHEDIHDEVTFAEENGSLLVFWGTDQDEVPDAIIVPINLNAFK